MRVLLDTNIVIHRESVAGIHESIGTLFRWLDKLHSEKLLHPASLQELETYLNPDRTASLAIKLQAYQIIKSPAKMLEHVQTLSDELDTSDNDRIDTILLNEVAADRVDYFITEDKKAHRKAAELGISERVFRIPEFIEKATAEQPELIDYPVPTVRKELFGDINVSDSFFDSFRDSYAEFDAWFNRKADETAYVSRSGGNVVAFLYVKVEEEGEPYPDITPVFSQKKRLKIGTLKVALQGHKLGERLLKIVFDNAIRQRVEEVYVTVFPDELEREILIDLLKGFGFEDRGTKSSANGSELVLVRDMAKAYDVEHPRRTYPFFPSRERVLIVPIYPDYHTSLFPDSILNTESSPDFEESEPHRNAIQKVYVCRSLNRDVRCGDVIVFYRTGGGYKGVATTVGIAERVVDNIESADELVRICRKRSVFSDKELVAMWDYNPRLRPFAVHFLHAYSLPKRVILRELIKIGVIADLQSVPRGFEEVSSDSFRRLLKAAKADDGFIVYPT